MVDLNLRGRDTIGFESLKGASFWEMEVETADLGLCCLTEGDMVLRTEEAIDEYFCNLFNFSEEYSYVEKSQEKMERKWWRHGVLNRKWTVGSQVHYSV